MDTKTTLTPYLTFNGNAREAMNFYKEALGAEHLEIMTFADAPMETPEAINDHVMHATLIYEDLILMASDSSMDEKVTFGNAIAISISTKDEAKAEKFFTNLSVDGNITMPFEKTFWAAKFGMFIDKFGINWMINCDFDE